MSPFIFHWNSIKYDSCHTINSYGGEGAEEEGRTPAGLQHLVKYHLCPTTSDGDCKDCGSGGSYVAEARDFVEAYLEVKKKIEEAKKNVTTLEGEVEKAKQQDDDSYKQKALEIVNKDKVSVLEAKLEVAKADVESFEKEKVILEKLKVALTSSIGK